MNPNNPFQHIPSYLSQNEYSNDAFHADGGPQASSTTQPLLNPPPQGLPIGGPPREQRPRRRPYEADSSAVSEAWGVDTPEPAYPAYRGRAASAAGRAARGAAIPVAAAAAGGGAAAAAAAASGPDVEWDATTNYEKFLSPSSPSRSSAAAAVDTLQWVGSVQAVRGKASYFCLSSERNAEDSISFNWPPFSIRSSNSADKEAEQLQTDGGCSSSSLSLSMCRSFSSLDIIKAAGALTHDDGIPAAAAAAAAAAANGSPRVLEGK